MIRILKYGEDTSREIIEASTPGYGVEDAVTEIIATVRRDGDAALFAYSAKFDGAKLSELRVSAEEIEAAIAETDPELVTIIKQAAANIRKFHEKQVRAGFIINDEDGVVVGQKVIPIERVGLYVPGGTAAYPSTVLMDAIPAKIAGCREIVMVTPPGKDGKINPAILTAASIAGVDKIFKVGGAQAIAALAYGTESIPKVEKIVGPGNAYVAEAKKQVFGLVSIDMIAGPSEILMVADGGTDPRFAAADMLAQAEHDRMSSAVLITDSEALAEAVAAELEKQLEALPRREIASASIEKNGKKIIKR
ncbi:MAG: histidinol dehydrogenase [Oscillospiraceae bacterium]|nr:histidinol dehydrogenase [Oscillospiraceae bacterium]